MPICNDRTAKELSKRGYSLVRYPRPTILPLDVIAGEKSPLEWLGPLPSIWSAKSPPPKLKTGEVPELEYDSTDEFRGTLALRILQGLINKISADISISSSLSFAYESPKLLSVSLFEVGEYLKEGDLDTANIILRRYLNNEEILQSRFYLITEVIRASKLVVRVSGADSGAVSADAAALKSLGDGSAELRNVRRGTSEVAFDGREDLTFAFRAFELGYDSGQWIAIGAAEKSTFLGGEDISPFGAAPVVVR